MTWRWVPRLLTSSDKGTLPVDGANCLWRLASSTSNVPVFHPTADLVTEEAEQYASNAAG